MATLTITKTYADASLLEEQMLDPMKTSTEAFFNSTKLDDDNIQDGGITASLKFKDGSIDSAGISSSAITTSNISDSSITTAKIADANVTTAKIADSAVTTAKIADGAVTSIKLPNSEVTQPKLSITNDNAKVGVNFPSFSSDLGDDIYEFSLTLTGRPLLIQVGTGTIGVSSAVEHRTLSGTGADCRFELIENGTSLSGYFWISPADADFKTAYMSIETLYFLIEAPSPGVHSFSLRLTRTSNELHFTLGSNPVEDAYNVIAYEL